VSERLAGLSFFFPARNEELNVAPMVARALEVLPKYADRVEVTVVDDGSTDATGELADALAELQRCAGAQFDREVVAAFARSLKQPALGIEEKQHSTA